MKIIHIVSLTALVGVAFPASGNNPTARCFKLDTPECKPIREAACRKAVDESSAHLESVPARTERDRADLKQLRDSQAALIKEQRAKGGSECEIWKEISRRAVKS